MPPALLQVIPLILAAAALVLPLGPARRLAAIGTAFVALATVAADQVTSAPSSFHTINNAIWWCGLMLVAGAAAAGWRAGQRATVVPVVVALLLALAGAGGAVREGRVLLSLLAGLVGAAALAALRVGAAAPLGTEAGAVARAGGIRRWALPLLLSLFLLPALWFSLTVAGPEGWTVQGLREAPFSEAGETLLAALLLPASLILAGTWPFAGVARGPRFAPLGALLLVVVVLPLAGEGMAHWRSAYAGWLVLGAVVASVGARWPQFLAAAGLFAIACGDPSAGWAGVALTVIASVLSLVPGAPALPGRIAMLLAAGCGMVALRTTLGAEVVYSVAMVLATIIGVLRTPLPAASGR